MWNPLKRMPPMETRPVGYASDVAALIGKSGQHNWGQKWLWEE